MSEEKNEKLLFERQGDNGMGVEIVGSSDTLRSMIHAALMNHKDLRTLFMPIVLKLINDNEFKQLCVNDMINDIGKNIGFDVDEDTDDEPLITD